MSERSLGASENPSEPETIRRAAYKEGFQEGSRATTATARDLRDSLALIVGFAELLKVSLSDPRQLMYLKGIEKAATRIEEIAVGMETPKIDTKSPPGSPG